MKIIKLIIILVCFALISAGTTTYIYSHNKIIDVKIIEAQVRVEDYVGINLDTDKLYFGTLSPGGSAQRDIIVSYSKTKAAQVHIITEGEIGQWITPTENDFIIENSIKSVKFTIRVPRDTPFGNYTGKIKMYFKKAASSI